MAQTDDAVDNIDDLPLRYKGEQITFAELKEIVPGVDIINDDPFFGNKITVKLPVMKNGEYFSEQFNIPLSKGDKKIISKFIQKTLLK